MKPYDDDTFARSPLRQAAGGTAIVTGVFGAIIAVLLTVQVYHYTLTDPERALALEEMKLQYTRQPADEQLAQQIHEMDIRIRRDQFARLYFLQRGTVLLLVDLAVLIGAVLIRTRHLRKPALPTGAEDRKKEQILHAQHVRTAVTLTAIVLGAGGLYLAQRPFGSPAENGGVSNEQPQPTDTAESAFASFEQMAAQWPSFRGADGSGVTTLTDIPNDWDGESGRNILWKSQIPLPGHNSPVIWENRIFLSGATEESFQVYCFDLTSGQLLWQGDIAISSDPARADMHILEDTGYAASTVVTDGKRVCAIFADGQVGCFTVEGKPLWQRSLGVPQSAYGYAASLTAFEKNVIVQFDVTYETEKSRLIGLDWQTGNMAWQTPRPVPNSWTSPTVVKIGQTYQVLTSGSPWVIAYDPKTGSELYRADCLGGDVAPTQIPADGKIIAVEPYSSLAAVNTENASGNVTDTHIAWRTQADMPDICSPVSNGMLVWTVTSNGTLVAFDLSDGSQVYEQSLNIEIQASPSLVRDTLYLLTVKGTMILAESGREYREIKRLELGDKCYASPAFAPGRIVLRGQTHLYCIGEQPSAR